MSEYRYAALDASGRERTGVVRADTEALAAAALEERGFHHASIEEEAQPSLFERSLRIRRGAPRKELVVFYRELSVLVSAEVPLVSALATITGQTANPVLREALTSVTDDVESGGRLSDALAAFPHLFSSFIVAIVRSGEGTGRLAETLEYLADEQEKDYELISKIRGALSYPAFIVTGLIGVGIVVLVWVVPKLTAVIAETGAALPLPTRILIATSGFAGRFWWLALLLAICGIAAMRVALQTPGGRYAIHAFLLSLPVFGGLFQRIAIVRWSRSLETLLAGGVDLSGALTVSRDVVGNAVFESLIDETRREVADGRSITTALSESRYVPRMLPQMLAVGEDTGKLQEVLRRMSQFFSKEIDRLVANLTNLIEPFVMLLLGIGVGGMVAAVILPMYSIATSF